MTASPDTMLPTPLAIEGLSFRAYAGEGDIPDMVELKTTVNAANGNTEVPTVPEERNELANVPHLDPRVDFINAWVHDQLVATSAINWNDTTEGQRHYYSKGWVHPDWRQRGIGGAMAERNEVRLRELARGHDHRIPPMLITGLDDGDQGGSAHAAMRGYQRVRVYHHMVRSNMDDIDVPELADGIDARAVARSDLPHIWDALVEAFRDHWGGQNTGPEARRSWLDDPAMDTSLFAVAFDGDEIAAGVLGYVIPEENARHGYARGWADPVFTRRPWRRRGLARAMMGRCLVLLRDAGMTSAQLEVDTENPADALSLYRGHGFETDRGASEWHKPL